MSFPTVTLLCNYTSSQLHHICDRIAILHFSDYMHVITGHIVPQHGYSISLHTDPKPFPVYVTFLGETEEELSIVAPVRKVINEAFLEISCCPWHGQTPYRTTENR